MSGGHVSEETKKITQKIGWVFFCIILLAYVVDKDFVSLVDLGIPVETPNTIGTYYTVTKVTDGDTIHIRMDGQDETVRLIGINTPETVDPRRSVECFGKEASEAMKSFVEGKIVRLEYDDSQSLRDTYGRILAYVYLEDGQMVNRKMVAEGYAYEYTYMMPYHYQKEFRQVQQLAKTSLRGLWSPSTCGGSKALPIVN